MNEGPYFNSLAQFDSGASIPRGALLGNRIDPDLEHPHRPMPSPNGELRIDPEIVLNAMAFDVQLSFFYTTSSSTSVNREFGYRRSSSARAYIASDEVNGAMWAVRGDLNAYLLSETSNAGSVTNYACTVGTQGLTTLSFDSSSGIWNEYFPDGYILQYEAQQISTQQKYCLTAVIHPSSYQHTYSYGSGTLEGLLVSIEEPAGRLVSFNYIPGPVVSLVNSVEDWSGRLWTLAYDANANLTAFTTPTGCQTQYTYAGAVGSQFISTIEDPRGFISGYTVDSGGQVTTMALGAAIYSYTYSETQQTMMSPTGALTTYNFLSMNEVTRNRPEGYTSSFAYNSNRLRISETVPSGLLYSVSYDSSGRFLVREDPLGNLITNQYDSVGNLTTITDQLGNNWVQRFDSARNFLGMTDPVGNRSTATYGPYGNLLSFEDGRGLITTSQWSNLGYMTAQINSDGGVVANQYDVLGRLIATTDPINRTTSFAYDVGDNLISTTNANGETRQFIYQSCLLQASIDPLGNRTSFTYGRFSNQLTMQNALGYVWTNLWDSMGYPIGSIDPMGNQTTVVYNAAKQRIASIDEIGFITSQSYDSSGRWLAVQDGRGNLTSNIWNARDIIALQNSLGYLWSSTFDARGKQIAQVSPLGFVNCFVFDALNHMIATRDEMDCFTTITYDAVGNQIAIQDPNNLITSFVYSPTSNRLYATIDPMNYRTTNQYDVAGQLTTITNPKGHIQMGYDLAGRRTFIANERGFATTTSYNANGLPVTIMDADSRVMTLTYDAVNNMLTKKTSDGAILTQVYDPLNRLTTAIDHAGATTFAYSARSEMIAKTDPGLLSQAYRFDAVSNRIGLTDPDSGLYTYGFDALNRENSLVDRYGGLYTSQYDPDGRMITLLHALGNIEVSGYDPAGRLTTLIVLNDLSQPISTIVSTYDAGGRKINDLNNGVLSTYLLDNDSRLTSQQKTNQYATFTYDGMSNLLVKWHQGSAQITMTYDSASRIVGSIQGSALTTWVHNNSGFLFQENQTGGNTVFNDDPSAGKSRSPSLTAPSAHTPTSFTITCGELCRKQGRRFTQ
jgi:YD repeat-containing protein